MQTLNTVPPVMAIVTPSYNQGEYLERAIVSVLEQRDPNLRYAVVDGGSQDRSVEIIKKYEKYLSFWCSEPDGGQAAAIKKGFTKIGGDIRGWLNSDDEYVRGAFRRVRHEFSKDPDVGLVYGERVLIDAKDRVLGWSRLGPYDPSISGYSIASETAFWSVDAEERVGSIDDSLHFAMDLDFFTRIYLSERTKKISEYLGMFRCHDESKSATISEVGVDETEKLWEKYFGPSMTWKIQPKRLFLRHALAGVRHPRLLGFPYLAHRVLARSETRKRRVRV